MTFELEGCVRGCCEKTSAIGARRGFDLAGARLTPAALYTVIQTLQTSPCTEISIRSTCVSANSHSSTFAILPEEETRSENPLSRAIFVYEGQIWEFCKKKFCKTKSTLEAFNKSDNRHAQRKC